MNILDFGINNIAESVHELVPQWDSIMTTEELQC